jgi:hypothetical protein
MQAGQPGGERVTIESILRFYDESTYWNAGFNWPELEGVFIATTIPSGGIRRVKVN